MQSCGHNIRILSGFYSFLSLFFPSSLYNTARKTECCPQIFGRLGDKLISILAPTIESRPYSLIMGAVKEAFESRGKMAPTLLSRTFMRVK